MERKKIEILKNGGVAVIPTDTIYGLVGSVFKPETVARISRIKNRSNGKGFIVLISSIEDLKIFGIKLTNDTKEFLDKYWPGKVSVEFFYNSPKFEYLRRPEGCNAFRLPNNLNLLEVLKQTGPLIAPSANPEGLPPAKNILEAKSYFGETVDFYEDGGELVSTSSTLVDLRDGHIKVLRQGEVIISNS